jgi:hypothetical protein
LPPGFASSSSSLVARVAAMPTAELEAFFQRKESDPKMVPSEGGTGQESEWGIARGGVESRTDEQQRVIQQVQTEEEDAVEVVPLRMMQGQQRVMEKAVEDMDQNETERGEKQYRDYLQHHQVQPQQREQQQETQPLNYTQAQQGVANVYLADRQQSPRYATSARLLSPRPVLLPSHEDEHIRLALSHYYYRQQQQQQQQQQYQGAPVVNQRQGTMPVGPSDGRGQEQDVLSLVASSSRVPFPLPHSTPVFDENLLDDVFADEEREGGDVGGLEEEKTIVAVGISPRQPATYIDFNGRPSTQLQHQYYQHMYQQKEEDLEEVGTQKAEEGVSCAPCLPSLMPSLSSPTPVLNEAMLEAIFAGKGTEECVDGEGGTNHGEEREEKKEGKKEAEEEDAFMADDGEVLDLFKDGDIETW